MTYEQLEEYLLGLPHAWLDFPFGEDVCVYKVGEKDSKNSKMFALIPKNVSPARISLKCDPTLAETLRETYETVLPGYHLNKRHWNTIICSGQIDDEELIGFMRHSYELVSTN